MLAMLAVISSGALIAITSVLKSNTAMVAASMESVRLTEEAETRLLLLARANDPVVKASLEAELRTLLASAADHVSTGEEARALEQANVEVARYRTASHAASADARELESVAYAALQRLVDINLDQSRAATASSVWWDRFASILGIIVALLILGITITLVLWFRGRVVRPLFALAETVRRFGEGDRSARAEPRGPLELARMSASFNEMADSLATQRESQLAFLAGVAHDLRGPLGTLRVAVDLASPDHPLPPEPQLRHVLAIADRQITQLDRMASDFLAISQIEAGKLELEVANHDLRAIAASAIEHLDGKQRVTLELSSDPVVVPCDDTRVGQAITNLLSNALKYSPPTEPVQVVVARGQEDAVIEVVDRGVGIPIEDQRMIFEPFRRRRATSRVPGTGLGLFNVKHLVEAHGGRVELESTPSRGSIFRVHLPLRHAS